MIYIIGSGFSGLVTAYALRKKYKKITIISPSKNSKVSKSSTLIKYLSKLNGEIKFNDNSISKKISFFEKNKYQKCKFISSYQDGGLSNIWGGVLSNIFNYNLKCFPFKLDQLKKVKKDFINLEKIIFKKNYQNITHLKTNDKNIKYLNFNKKIENTDNLRNYLIRKNIIFKNNLYLKKIFSEKNQILLHDLVKNKEKILNYKKLYISAGPINTAKIILNSFKNLKTIKLKETRHFYCIVKKNSNLNELKYFKFKDKKTEFYSQLYSFKEVMNLFLKNFNHNLFKNLFIAQCYFNAKKSGHIEIKKIKRSNFLITGKENFLIKKQILKAFKSYNKKNKQLKFYFPVLNSIGASNHFGASFPMSKKKEKFKTNLNGQLYNYKDIYISDSSVLNEVDMQPITMFSLINILRMHSNI